MLEDDNTFPLSPISQLIFLRIEENINFLRNAEKEFLRGNTNWSQIWVFPLKIPRDVRKEGEKEKILQFYDEEVSGITL